MDKEPQTNGKTINWCQPSTSAERHTARVMPQGIVCGAHNFGAGDKVVVTLPGAVLPGDFQISARKTYGHVSAGMICLGPRARHRRGPRRHPRAVRLGAGQPGGTDAIELLGLDDEVVEIDVNPDRGYALSMRGVARARCRRSASAFRSPTRADRAVPDGRRQGLGTRRGRRHARLRPVFAARTGHAASTRPRPTPAVDAYAALRLAGMRSISLAVDISNYVMLELGQPMHGYDAGQARPATSWCVGHRRARSSPRSTAWCASSTPRTSLITDDSGPIGLAGVMGGASRPRCRRPRPRRPRRGRALRRRVDRSASASATSSRPRPPSASSVASTHCCPAWPPTASSS